MSGPPLTIPEAADALRCSTKTIRRAIKRGTIPATFFGGRYLIAEADLPTSLPPRPAPPVRQAGKRGEAGALARRIAGAR